MASPNHNATLDEQRRNLPIHSAKKRLIKELNNRTNAILIGETGCGKTTQVPQVGNQSVLSRDELIRIYRFQCVLVIFMNLIIT